MPRRPTPTGLLGHFRTVLTLSLHPAVGRTPSFRRLLAFQSASCWYLVATPSTFADTRPRNVPERHTNVVFYFPFRNFFSHKCAPVHHTSLHKLRTHSELLRRRALKLLQDHSLPRLKRFMVLARSRFHLQSNRVVVSLRPLHLYIILIPKNVLLFMYRALFHRRLSRKPSSVKSVTKTVQLCC